MRAMSLVHVAVAGALCAGCMASVDGASGGGGADGTGGGAPDPFAVSTASASEELRQNVLERRAIFLGNKLASEVFEAALNAEVIGFGVTDRYVDVAMTPSSPRKGRFEGAPEGWASPIDVTHPAGDLGSASACAFAVRPPAIDPSALSCRYVAREASRRAVTRGVQRLAEQPIDPALLADAVDPDAVSGWYARAFDFGLSASPEIAVDALRGAGLCDREPSQQEAAVERGVQLGRDEIRAQVASTVAVTPRTVCDIDGGIVGPARAAAMARVPELASSHPLCPEYVPADLGETGRLAAATDSLRQGIASGIEEGAREESARLVREWICEIPVPAGGGGDPLVLDLDGDGVHVEPIAYGATFDFGDTGPVRSQWIWGDAFVVLDRDGDGRIAASELFGDVTVTEDGARASDGFGALGLYDAASRGGNGDGLIDEQDAVFDSLGLWMDRDGDARADDGEIVSLAGSDVAAIDPVRGRWLGSGGVARAAVDVWLEWR